MYDPYAQGLPFFLEGALNRTDIAVRRSARPFKVSGVVRANSLMRLKV